MPPTILTGSVGSGGPVSDTLRQVREVSDKIFKKGPNIAPLTVLSRMASKESVFNQSFEILEDEPLPRFTRINNGAGYADNATSIVVDNGNYARPQDVVKVTRTGEVLLVTAISTNTWTVVRAHGATPAAAMVDNDELLVMALAGKEKLTPPDAKHTQVAGRTNYTQFFSRTTDVTEIGEHTKKYDMKERQRQIAGIRYELLRDIELSFKFGEPLKDVEGSSPKDGALDYTRYSTGGFKHWIDTSASGNVLNAGGILTQSAFWDFVGPLFKNIPDNVTNGKKRLAALCSTTAFKVFHQWALPPLQTSLDDKKYGIQIITYLSPFGEFNLIQDYSLDGDEYGDYIMIVNPDFVGYRYLEGMDVNLKPNIQPNNAHYMQDELYGVCGFWIAMPALHGYITDVRLAG